jgi:hypothetical protein
MESLSNNEPPWSPVSTTEIRAPRFEAPLFNRIACLLSNYLQKDLMPDDPAKYFGVFQAPMIPVRTVLMTHLIPATSELAARHGLASIPRLHDIEIVIAVTKIPPQTSLPRRWSADAVYELIAEARCRDILCKGLPMDTVSGAGGMHGRLVDRPIFSQPGLGHLVGVCFALELRMIDGKCNLDDMHWNKVLKLLRRTSKWLFNSHGETRTEDGAGLWNDTLERLEPIGNHQIEATKCQ